ncbi:CENP-Q, a CENPA-CAD centromere complex subunit-domain-containing protein [Coniochaeta sp. 2T2.1]|nr:CENP-Q, a CENPA-CAD centromere complex subunit-domain-containing protein [Coniochaeta sp. 2T2.1]
MSAVNTKWSKLDGATVEAISTIISDTSITVLHRWRDNQRRYQPGHDVLRAFAGKLRNKLRKGQPFPPASTQPPGTKSAAGKSGASDGRREELSFESIVDSIDSMETMLNPLLHSVGLLEKQKAKEETALEKEYETLRTLEANAKAEAAGWRERMRKAHPLAPDPRKRDDAPELDRLSGDKLSLVKKESTPLVGVFSDATDEALLSISKQVASHMSSIQKNMQPVQDVPPAIAKSRAALQVVLQTYLAPQQFERILLG